MRTCLFRTLMVPLALMALAPAQAAERREVNLFSAAEFDRHVRHLASDDLQGRGVGSDGIEAAAQYLAEQLREIGVRPGGDQGTFFQSFDVSISKRIGEKTRLVVRGDERRRLEVSRDFVPMPFSKSDGFDGPLVFVGYGIDESDEHDYNDYDGVDVRGKVVLMFRYEPGWWSSEAVDEQEVQTAARRHTRHAYFTTKAEHARKRGAKAILIVNPYPRSEKEPDRLYDFDTGRSATLDLPMLHVTRAAAEHMLSAAGLPSLRELQERIETSKNPASASVTGLSVNGYVELARVDTPVKNVVGLIPGEGPTADEYVVIGAHYDHLGLTTNWRKPNDANKYIHNGADDNASGTAALVLLARALKAGPPLKRSVILIAFTAEESGLLGSKHWVKHPTVPIQKVVAMLNMDMIGRLKNNSLQVGGMLTGSGFEELVRAAAESEGLKVRSGGGGRGPSDHASFYGAEIPVLFFFTGMHRQYHQPEDDADLVNAEGGARVTRLVMRVATAIADGERPKFQRDATRFRPERQRDDDQVARASDGDERDAGGEDASAHGAGAHGDADVERPAMPRVRLGIAPGNYGEAEGRGFPIEYVVDGGPAQKAGLRDGDRILKLGDREITDVYSYMNALSRFKPGEPIRILVLRGDKELTFDVKPDAAPRSRSE